MTTNHPAALHTLGDRGQTVDEPANDVRGRYVKDQHGDGIGEVADLLADDEETKIRFLLVEHGGPLGFAVSQSLIPIDAVTTTTQDAVIIDQSRERVAAAPGYAPELLDNRITTPAVTPLSVRAVLGPGIHVPDGNGQPADIASPSISEAPRVPRSRHVEPRTLMQPSGQSHESMSGRRDHV